MDTSKSNGIGKVGERPPQGNGVRKRRYVTHSGLPLPTRAAPRLTGALSGGASGPASSGRVPLDGSRALSSQIPRRSGPCVLIS